MSGIVLNFVRKCINANYFRFNKDVVARTTRQSNNLHLPYVRTETAKRSFYYNGCQIFKRMNVL